MQFLRVEETPEWKAPEKHKPDEALLARLNFLENAYSQTHQELFKMAQETKNEHHSSPGPMTHDQKFEYLPSSNVYCYGDREHRYLMSI